MPNLLEQAINATEGEPVAKVIRNTLGIESKGVANDDSRICVQRTEEIT